MGAHLHLSDNGLGAIRDGRCHSSAGEAQGLGEHAEQCWMVWGCHWVLQHPVNHPFLQVPPATG